MSADNVSVNTDKRLFYISGEINSESMGEAAFNLLYILSTDDEKETKEKGFKRNPIHMYINSPGGYLPDMWSLVDIMLKSKTPIYTYCTGWAQSAAFKIFLAGSKRFIGEHAVLMYHQMYTGGSDKYQDIVEYREQQDADQDAIEKYVASRTKLSEEDLKSIRESKKDYYIRAEEAIKIGAADAILK